MSPKLKALSAIAGLGAGNIAYAGLVGGGVNSIAQGAGNRLEAFRRGAGVGAAADIGATLGGGLGILGGYGLTKKFPKNSKAALVAMLAPYVVGTVGGATAAGSKAYDLMGDASYKTGSVKTALAKRAAQRRAARQIAEQAKGLAKLAHSTQSQPTLLAARRLAKTAVELANS